MYFFSKVLRKFSREILYLAEKVEVKNADPLVFNLNCRDLFETTSCVTQFIQPKYLCDIGANCGQWAYVLHQLNPDLQHVVFFEPQNKFQEKLHSLRLPGVSKVIYQCGLGEKEERLSIKGGTASASFLEATDIQEDYFPNSILFAKEEVEIKVLDKIYAQNELPYPDLIKIDVQGFELSVLRGAVNVLSQAKCLVIELSFRQFYDGQPPLWEIFKFLEENNYIMVGRGWESRATKNRAELLQLDGIFINTRLVKNLGK